MANNWTDHKSDDSKVLGGKPSRAFTRRHYSMIADVLHDAIEVPEDFPPVRRVASRLATMFRHDNPAFDDKGFLSRVINGA